MTDHAAQFRRLYQQEQFLKANQKFFWTIEGLDLQVAIAQVRHFCEDPEVAHHWSNVLESLSAAVSRLLDLPRRDTEIWKVNELFELWERLVEYAKQPQKEAMGLQRPTPTRQPAKKQQVTRKGKPSK